MGMCRFAMTVGMAIAMTLDFTAIVERFAMGMAMAVRVVMALGAATGMTVGFAVGMSDSIASLSRHAFSTCSGMGRFVERCVMVMMLCCVTVILSLIRLGWTGSSIRELHMELRRRLLIALDRLYGEGIFLFYPELG